MKKMLVLFAIVAGGALFTGCASGPKYSAVKATLPPLAQDQGRIYFYRTTVGGAAVQPSVKLNGQEIGTAAPEGFFYADRPPGNYTVETTTEVTRRLSLTLDPGAIRYVRLNMAMGFFVGHVWPELIEPAVGEKEMQGCHYTGK